MGSEFRRMCPLNGFLTLLAVLTLFPLVNGALGADGNPWYRDLCSYQWKAVDQDTGVRYSLKLCSSSPDTACGESSAVCAHDLATNGNQSLGELSLLKLSDSVLDFGTTQKCIGGRGNISTSISFQCAKTMVCGMYWFMGRQDTAQDFWVQLSLFWSSKDGQGFRKKGVRTHPSVSHCMKSPFSLSSRALNRGVMTTGCSW